jgi:hypothetical protein
VTNLRDWAFDELKKLAGSPNEPVQLRLEALDIILRHTHEEDLLSRAYPQKTTQTGKEA